MKRRIQIIYLLISLFLLISFLVLSFQQEHGFERQKFDVEAKALYVKFKVFIQNLEKDVTLLNKHIPNTSTCSEIAYLLQAFSFNHPQVSAIAVISPPHLYCSSAKNLPIIQPNKSYLHLSGPNSSPLFTEKYYTLYYKINERIYEVYLLSSVLQKTLQPSTNLIGEIKIFNSGEPLPVISLISNIDTSRLENSKNVLNHSRIWSNYTIKHHLDFYVYNNQQQTYKIFWFYELLQFLILIVGIILIYIPLHLLLNRRYSIHGSIRNAIRNGYFFPVYQPIFDWQNNTYSAVEVLLRWRDTDNKIIMPNTFIEAAEKSGLIEPITRIIIKTSFKDMQYWLHQDRKRHLAFNISAAHLNDKNLFLYLKSHCEKYDIIPEQIMLELTEREIIDAKNEGVAERIQQLRDAGFSFAIDDFGTGNASFNYLNNLPINYLKIDKMYVHAIGSDSIPAKLIESIISLAKKLKLGIIAEGVETLEQEKFLKEHNIQLLQGWLYAKAMPKKELFKKINSPPSTQQ